MTATGTNGAQRQGEGTASPTKSTTVGSADVLASLLERVEKAEGMSALLFWDVAMAAAPDLGPLDVIGRDVPVRARLHRLVNAEAWESAAHVLCERVLPDAYVMVSSLGAPWSRWRADLKTDLDFVSGRPLLSLTTFANTPALALLAAMLEAKIAQP